jgi:TolA-binding protein
VFESVEETLPVAMKTAERQHLKTNEVADIVSRFKATMDTAGPRISRLLLAGLVVLLVVGGFFAWRNYAATKAQAMLAEALTVDTAAVVPPAPPAQPGQPAPQPPPAGSFPTEQARREAALAKFTAAAAAHPSTDAGTMARYRAASIYAEMGKLGDAEREFKTVADSGGALYGQMATLGLADLQVRQGQYDPAITTFRELSTRTDGTLPIDGILMQLGRAQVLAGKTTEAVQTFKRIADEFPQSPYVTEARRQVETLSGGPGA